MTPIELNFQYTESDFQEFLRNYFFKRRLPVMLLTAILMIILVSMWSNGNDRALYIAIPLGVLVITWFFVYHNLGRRSFRAMPQMQEGRNVTIDGEKVQVTGHTFSSEFKWEGVMEVVETSKQFLLYNSKVSAVILPKRAFSPEQMSAFRTLVDGLPGLTVKWKKN